MQAYQIDCDCGATETFARLSETRPRADDSRFIEVCCEACGAWCRPAPSANVRHVGIITSEVSDQLGIEFRSTKEKKAYLAKTGLTEMDVDSPEYREAREQWKDEARSKQQTVPAVHTGINGKIKSSTPIEVAA